MQYETMKKIPLTELLECYNVVNAACTCYENELRPLFGTQNPSEQARWSYINANLQTAKKCREAVLSVMLEKCYDKLENYHEKTLHNTNKKKTDRNTNK